MPRVRLFGAAGCHLCEVAEERLAPLADELGFAVEKVDITGVAELEQAYREWLPVVEVDGERWFVYHVDPDGFRRRWARTVGAR